MMEGRRILALLCVVSVALLFLLPPSALAESATAVTSAATTLEINHQPNGIAEASKMIFRGRRLSDDDDDDCEEHDDDDDDHHHRKHHKPCKSPSPPPPPPSPPPPSPRPPSRPKKKLTCLEKLKLRTDKCDYREACCKREAEDEDEKAICEVADESCERKAYMLYKKCKYGKWTCKNWCDYNKMKCVEDEHQDNYTCHERAGYCCEKCNPKPKPKLEPKPEPEPVKDDNDDDHHHDDDDDEDN